MASGWNKFTDWMGWTSHGVDEANSQAQDILNKALAEYNAATAAAQDAYKEQAEAANANYRDIQDYYNEGNSVAGTAARNKSGQAMARAKAAAAMNGATKMQQILSGAQAANDAVTSGYDEAMAQAAGSAQQNAATKASAAHQQAQNILNAALQAQQAGLATAQAQAGLLVDAANAKAQRQADRRNTMMQSALGVGGQVLNGYLSGRNK